MIAGNLYRLFARKPAALRKRHPRHIWRHFLDATGTLHITGTPSPCALNLRSHHPVLIDAGYADLEVPIPWWDGTAPCATGSRPAEQPQANLNPIF